MNKKKNVVFFIFVIILSLNFVSAINLTINSKPIQDAIINDAGKPALYEITIHNEGPEGNFEIYTFERFRIEPNEVSLTNGETKRILVSFYPEGSMKKNVGHLRFPVYVREKGGSKVIKSEFFLKLIDFNELFDIKAENINPDSTSVIISFYNIESLEYEKINLKFSSNFFNDFETSLPLTSYQKKDFNITLNKNKFRNLIAGTYTITTLYEIEGRSGKINSPIKLLEKSGLSVKDESSGIIIRINSVEKTNEGNLPTVAEISVRKNIISRLFTTFSIYPDRVKRNGIYVDYEWQKELQPSETLKVKITTNWIFPLLLVIAVSVIIYIANLYFTSHLIMKKRASFVKTKGGEFALKVTLRIKAKKFMEKISIYDRIPPTTKIYEGYEHKSTKFDKNTGRIQWDIPRLGEGEERIFSYIIFSKVKIVGKFELPSAMGVYELNGKVHESQSNRTFFIYEPEQK
ncbi:MAG: hypothetical protein QW727_02690 [Candidatus Pacearchaeota archaeon]